MSNMERNFDKRLDTTKLVENSKSVISLTYNYYPKKVLKSDSTFKISKYAYGTDYHIVLKKKLKQLLNIMKDKFGSFEGRVFVDSAPILERAWAKKSGLGWIGKNTNLINKQSGSFFFLAEIIVDLELNYDNTTTDHCGSCTACIDACPTNAIYEPYKLDASRCISYYTIELKESFSSNLSSDFKDWIFGCDICQDVCPWNRFSKANDEVLFETIPEISNFNKTDWIDLTEETFKKVFKESPIKRSKFKGLKEISIMLGKNLRNLPKIELHLHLDCCLSFDVVKKINPKIDIETYNKKFKAPSTCSSVKEYIKCAEYAVDIMQDEKSISLIVEDLFEQLKAENIIYVEIRFAPLLHCRGELSSKEVVQIVDDICKKCSKKYCIHYALILCTLRHFSKNQSMETVQLVEEFKNSGVFALDIAADEAGFSLDNHFGAFDFAFENNISCTAHAGEAKGPESIKETLKKLKVKRIGHGVRCVEDKKLMNYLKNNNIHLEICLTSNIKTLTYESIDAHPIDKIFKSNISLSMSTDGRTISNIDLTSEYELVVNKFGWDLSDLKKVNIDAVNHSFTTSEIKKELLKKINSSY